MAPKLEVAFFYSIFSRLGLGESFLKIWRIPHVRMILNFPRTVHYRVHSLCKGSLLDEVEIARVANSLKRDGYAISHIDKFQNMPSILNLQREYDSLLELEKLKPHSRKSKAYIERLVDDDYDFKNCKGHPFSVFVQNPSLMAIASMYFNLSAKKTSFKVWRSHFTGERSRTASQNWHRDYNEFKMVRCFLYLNEVNLDNGAGEYVAGSHYLGDSYHKLEYSEELGTYATDEEISLNFTADRVIRAEGREGSLVFLDTAGLHRGGFHTIPSERRVALLTFSTAADIMPTRIST